MITEKDLQEAIAECQGVKNPNTGTCLKLAAFLTIYREMYGQEKSDNAAIKPYYQQSEGYSYDSGQNIGYESTTEFAHAIKGKRQDFVIEIMDELMTTLQIVQPRIYLSVLRKLEEL